MPIAYWCVLACVLLPYFLSVAARSQAARSDYIQDPRAYSETLAGWRRRAHLAHLNAFEATPAIVAGVMVCELAGAPRLHVDMLALAFVGFRLLHAVFYIADRPMLRGHAWRLGILCVIGLFVDGALYGQTRTIIDGAQMDSVARKSCSVEGSVSARAHVLVATF